MPTPISASIWEIPFLPEKHESFVLEGNRRKCFKRKEGSTISNAKCIQIPFKENVELQKSIGFVERVGILSSSDFIAMVQSVGVSGPSV